MTNKVDAVPRYADINDKSTSPKLKSILEWKVWELTDQLDRLLDVGVELTGRTPTQHIQTLYNHANLTDEEFIHCFVEQGKYNFDKGDVTPDSGIDVEGIDALLNKDVEAAGLTHEEFLLASGRNP